ncbi:hypothetical protein V6N12_062856 [Hibiscus sabdariffa]|uniref:RNase H type-1 domain-containing protein n=1 Tax=Hibiscus sabdariffa TaxID=183260 RepID=A0ABR2FA15_9ROSI
MDHQSTYESILGFQRADKSGLFSVRSGYRLLYGEDVYPIDEPSPIQQASAKVYVYHLLLECSFAKNVFTTLNIVLPTVLVEQQWLAHLFDDLSKVESKCLITTLWTHRNKKAHENVVRSPLDLANYIRQYIHEIDDIIDSRAINLQCNSQDRWTPPLVEYVKVNFDAGYNAITKSFIIRVIFRDPEGLLLVTSTCQISHISNPKIVEARAFDQAVALASDLGLRKSIVEGDAWFVIKKVKDSSIDMSDTFGFIRNINRRSQDFEKLRPPLKLLFIRTVGGSIHQASDFLTSEIGDSSIFLTPMPDLFICMSPVYLAPAPVC